MIKWLCRTTGLLLLVVTLVYGYVYGVDYLNYQDWSPKWTTLNGDPLDHPTTLSEKTYVFLMWTSTGCEYCATQLRAFYEFASMDGIPEKDFDIILVYADRPSWADPSRLAVLGPPRAAVPYTEFWVNHTEIGWYKALQWNGYYNVQEMQNLFTEALNAERNEEEPEA